MKAKDVQVGNYYIARVSGQITVVRLDAIREGAGRHLGCGLGGRSKGYTPATAYEVTNLRTDRQTTFRSASRFRKAVPTCKECGKPFTCFRKDNQRDTCLVCLGGERGQRSSLEWLDRKLARVPGKKPVQVKEEGNKEGESHGS